MAESCLRAGWNVSAIDQFGDWDLRKICPVDVVADLNQIPAAVAALHGNPLLLFGSGYESIVMRHTKQNWRFPVANCSRSAAWKAMDAGYWTNRMNREICRTPRIAEPGKPLPAGRWIAKPVGGSGGVGIRWTGECMDAGSWLTREFIPGNPVGVTAWSNGSHTEILGAFQILAGQKEFGAAEPFVYCGSIGPWRFSATEKRQLVPMVDEIIRVTGVRGLFGIDLVQTETDLVPIEINPRPTATCELMERLVWTANPSASILPLHFSAFGLCDYDDNFVSGMNRAMQSGIFLGKAVLYHDGPLPRIVSPRHHQELIHLQTRSLAADIPLPGTKIRPGQPVITLFSSDDSPEKVRDQLVALAASVRNWLRLRSPNM